VPRTADNSPPGRLLIPRRPQVALHLQAWAEQRLSSLLLLPCSRRAAITIILAPKSFKLATVQHNSTWVRRWARNAPHAASSRARDTQTVLGLYYWTSRHRAPLFEATREWVLRRRVAESHSFASLCQIACCHTASIISLQISPLPRPKRNPGSIFGVQIFWALIKYFSNIDEKGSTQNYNQMKAFFGIQFGVTVFGPQTKKLECPNIFCLDENTWLEIK